MREAFIETLSEMARKNDKIMLLTGDLGYGVLEKFAEEFPNQFINCGIAEQAMMGMAAGLASTGKRVFVYSIANFPTFRCLEQIRNDVCAMNNGVVVVSVGAGYSYGPQGYTHHAIEDIAAMRSLPNLKIFSPCDPIETRQLTKLLADNFAPSYLRLGKSKEVLIHATEPKLVEGKFNQISEGENGTIVFTGSIGVIAKEAQEILAQQGVFVALFSAPFISTIDVDLIKQRSSMGPIIIVEEHAIRGGFGSAVLEALAIDRVSADIRLIYSKQNDLRMIGDQKYLREMNGISAINIVKIFNT
jgi:transketolase